MDNANYNYRLNIIFNVNISPRAVLIGWDSDSGSSNMMSISGFRRVQAGRGYEMSSSARQIHDILHSDQGGIYSEHIRARRILSSGKTPAMPALQQVSGRQSPFRRGD